MGLFSDYVRKEVPFLHGTVALSLRALDKLEAPPFRDKVYDLRDRWLAGADRLENETDEQYRPRLSRLAAELHEFMVGVFTKTISTKTGEQGYYVRLPDPLVNEDDDSRTITEPVGLLDRAGRMFGFSVLFELAGLAYVDPFLGNSFGSQSTSPVDLASPTSASPVSSTAVEVCPSPSTATAPTPNPESSIEAA